MVVTRTSHEARGEPGLTPRVAAVAEGVVPAAPTASPDHRASRTTAASPAGVDGNARPGIAPRYGRRTGNSLDLPV